MVSIILTRHGETDHDGKIIKGQADIPLNEKGKEQAQAIASILKTLPITSILTSNLLRCTQGAEILSSLLKLKPEVDSRLAERNFGEHEGKSFTEIQEGKQGFGSMYEHALSCNCPGGETTSEFRNRLKHVLNDLVKKEGLVCIFTHGGVIVQLLDLLSVEGSAHDFRHDNGYVSYLELSSIVTVSSSIVNVTAQELVNLLKFKK